jgi:hypothetical protein
VGSYPLLSQAPTPVEVELGCDNRIYKGSSSPTIFATQFSVAKIYCTPLGRKNCKWIFSIYF